MGEWIDNLCQAHLPSHSAAVQIDAGPFNLYFLLLAFTTRSNFYLFISYKAKHSGRSTQRQRTRDQTGGSDCHLLGMQRVVSPIHNHPSIQLRSVCLSPEQTGKQKAKCKTSQDCQLIDYLHSRFVSMPQQLTIAESQPRRMLHVSIHNR